MKLLITMLLGLFICVSVTGADKEKDKPLPKDLKSLKALAEKGDAQAQNRLGWMFYSSIKVEKNKREALKWWRKAAEQENSGAQYGIGLIYSSGSPVAGVKRNERVAVKWIRNAAEQGYVNAQYFLGGKYYTGAGALIGGVEKDLVTAYAWNHIVVLNGYEDAKKFKGQLYRGFTPEQKTKAQELVREMVKKNPKLLALPLTGADNFKSVKALAEKGDAEAQNNLGNMYYDGEGVLASYKEAVKWFRKAAEQGNTDAQLFLGDMYYIADGVKKDDVTAYAWFKIAAASGDKLANKTKGSFAKIMTPEEIAKAEALAKEMIAKNPKLIKKP